jgi:hypothetical protein
MDEDEKAFRERLENEYREAQVKAMVDRGNVLSAKHQHIARTWLNEKELEKAKAQDDRAERALAAAEISARASVESSEAASRSARWAMWAVIVAVAALVVAALPHLLSWLSVK